MGMREDMYARSGPVSFSLDTTRDRIPTGSTHRYQIGKLSVAEICSMLRNTTRMLIARARQHGELDRKLWAAIDVTKGFPFTGDVEDHEDEKEFIHMIERLIRWYRRRWGIENGFKKQKHFMVRTISTERDYRFFNFVFACVLYNVWRLVDLLVKLAIDGENQSLLTARGRKPVFDHRQTVRRSRSA
jgi:IS4 transposase